MKNSSKNRLTLSSVALVLNFVSFLLGGVAEIVVQVMAILLVATALVMAFKRADWFSNICVWYSMCFCVVFAALLGSLHLSFIASLCSVVAFGLLLILVFRAMYFMQKICHKDYEDQLDKED